MFKRLDSIVKALESFSGFSIDGEIRALFVLALIASDRLDDYRRDNQELPFDPFLEYAYILENVKKYCGNDIE